MLRPYGRGVRAICLFAAVVLEGELYLGAVGDDCAFFELHVELDDLGYAEVTEAAGRHLYRGCRGGFPGFGAGADEFDDLVDALGHWGLLRYCGWLIRRDCTLFEAGCLCRGAGARGGSCPAPGCPSGRCSSFVTSRCSSCPTPTPNRNTR